MVTRSGRSSKATEKKDTAKKKDKAAKRKKQKKSTKKAKEVRGASDNEGSTADDKGEVKVVKGKGKAAGGGEGDVITVSDSDSDLEITITGKAQMRVEQARDLRTIFSDPPEKRMVNHERTKHEERGRWCTLCWDSKKLKKTKGDGAGWYTGGNSTCRRHIRAAHYAEYQKRCEEAGLEEDWQAVPKAILEARRAKEGI
ncbi:hypothetical protein LXA43DRAFT_1092759 [Ganoderma leucocontextum]|nr:hypothetical protein LXA43DRAFT_1092759 [Ganoderma leucocontextum]